MIMVTFKSGNKEIKRVFDALIDKGEIFLCVLGKCDCYKNSCDCVTLASIRKDTILKINEIQIAGDLNE